MPQAAFLLSLLARADARNPSQPQRHRGRRASQRKSGKGPPGPRLPESRSPGGPSPFSARLCVLCASAVPPKSSRHAKTPEPSRSGLDQVAPAAQLARQAVPRAREPDLGVVAADPEALRGLLEAEALEVDQLEDLPIARADQLDREAQGDRALLGVEASRSVEGRRRVRLLEEPLGLGAGKARALELLAREEQVERRGPEVGAQRRGVLEAPSGAAAQETEGDLLRHVARAVRRARQAAGLAANTLLQGQDLELQ